MRGEGGRCRRCCLQKTLRGVNLFVNLCGAALIIYSLWLRRMWIDGLADLPHASHSALPHPWFIYGCLAVGITVCLSALCGHMVANCISNSILCIYIVSICSLFVLQAGAITFIFYIMDLEAQLEAYIDENHERFKSFIIFHIYMSRLVTTMVLMIQINVIVVAAILRIVGTEPVLYNDIMEVPDFRHSFLVLPSSSIDDESRTSRKRCVHLIC